MPVMEDYLAAVEVLWPGEGYAKSFCRAVAQKCIRLGFGVNSRGHTCKALSLGGTFYTECTLLQAAVEQAGHSYVMMSVAAKQILPAEIFTVGSVYPHPMAIKLDLAALKLAAAEVLSHPLPEASVMHDSALDNPACGAEGAALDTACPC